MASNPELLLISAIINEADHVTPIINGITPDLFHSYPDEYEWVQKYIRTHRRAPSRTAFKAKFPGITINRNATDVEHFCLEVKESAAQAEVLDSMNDIVTLVKKGDLRGAIKMMNSASTRAAVSLEGQGGDDDIIGSWESTFDEVSLRVQRTRDLGQAGIPTGFPTLDERTGGPMPGDFWVVSARLGEGKSWTLNRMATAAVFAGFDTYYNSLEMTREQISMRFSTFASSVYGKEVFKNLDLAQGRNFDIAEYKRFLQELGKQLPNKFRVADQRRGPINLATIEAQLERHHPAVSFLDYITLMEGAREGDWRGTANISGGLKNLANRYGTPIVAAAQLNRNAAGRRDMPGAEDLAEGDSIGRDADVVITMRQMSKRVIAMKLVKNRGGRSGFVFYVSFLPNTGKMEEVTFDQAQDIMQEDKDENEDLEPSSIPKQRVATGFTPTKKIESTTAPERTKRRRIIRSKSAGQ